MSQKLQEAIQSVVTEFEYTIEQIENELITFLQEKYYLPPREEMLQYAIVQEAKDRIVKKLYSANKCEIGEGYNNYTTIPTYKYLLEMLLAPAHRLFFDQIINELLDDDLIYTKTNAGEKEPKVVGLTKKGILYRIYKNRYYFTG